MLGVHAISSTFHAELFARFLRAPRHKQRLGICSKEELLRDKLNAYFFKYEFDIRIQKVFEVPATFHCRDFVIDRTYLYRLLHYRGNGPAGIDLQEFSSKNKLPIIELDRCQVVSGSFDINAVQLASEILCKNSYFHHEKVSKSRERMIENNKTMMIEIRPGRGFLSPSIDVRYNEFVSYDFFFTSKSFLSDQIRRTMGALIAAGQGQLTVEDLLNALTEPHSEWSRKVSLAEPCGLYLLDVTYEPNSFILKTADT